MGGGEQPAVVVKFRRRTVVSMAVTGAALAGTAVSIGIGGLRGGGVGGGGGSIFAAVLAGLVGFTALFVLIAAVMTAARRRPVIEAGAAGVTVASLGMTKPLVLAWAEIAGFEVVGKGRQRMLVITGVDPSSLGKLEPRLKRITEMYNVQHKQPGLVYVHRSMMAVSPEETAARLREAALWYGGGEA